MRLGAVPVQPLQNRLRSALVNVPVTAGRKPWANQLVAVKPKPDVLRVVFCWSRFAGFVSTTSPALLVKSVLVGTPVWKSDCDVSVRHELAEAVPSVKFCVVVPPLVTARLLAVLELYPAALALSLG